MSDKTPASKIGVKITGGEVVRKARALQAANREALQDQAKDKKQAKATVKDKLKILEDIVAQGGKLPPNIADILQNNNLTYAQARKLAGSVSFSSYSKTFKAPQGAPVYKSSYKPDELSAAGLKKGGLFGMGWLYENRTYTQDNASSGNTFFLHAFSGDGSAHSFFSSAKYMYAYIDMILIIPIKNDQFYVAFVVETANSYEYNPALQATIAWPQGFLISNTSSKVVDYNSSFLGKILDFYNAPTYGDWQAAIAFGWGYHTVTTPANISNGGSSFTGNFEVPWYDAGEGGIILGSPAIHQALSNPSKISASAGTLKDPSYWGFTAPQVRLSSDSGFATSEPPGDYFAHYGGYASSNSKEPLKALWLKTPSTGKGFTIEKQAGGYSEDYGPGGWEQLPNESVTVTAARNMEDFAVNQGNNWLGEYTDAWGGILSAGSSYIGCDTAFNQFGGNVGLGAGTFHIYDGDGPGQVNDLNTLIQCLYFAGWEDPGYQIPSNEPQYLYGPPIDVFTTSLRYIYAGSFYPLFSYSWQKSKVWITPEEAEVAA